jgi:hypothetical protein
VTREKTVKGQMITFGSFFRSAKVSLKFHSYKHASFGLALSAYCVFFIFSSPCSSAFIRVPFDFSGT